MPVANAAAIRQVLRQIKNKPATAVAERVLSEWELNALVGVGSSAVAGKFLRLGMIDEVVAIAAAASGNMTTQLPANAKVLFTSTNNNTALTFGTAVKFGVGTAADPDRFLLSATTVTINTKNNATPLEAVGNNAAAVTVAVTAVDTDGAAAGTMTGSVRVRLIYVYAESLPNA